MSYRESRNKTYPGPGAGHHGSHRRAANDNNDKDDSSNNSRTKPGAQSKKRGPTKQKTVGPPDESYVARAEKTVGGIEHLVKYWESVKTENQQNLKYWQGQKDKAEAILEEAERLSQKAEKLFEEADERLASSSDNMKKCWEEARDAGLRQDCLEKMRDECLPMYLTVKRASDYQSASFKNVWKELESAAKDVEEGMKIVRERGNAPPVRADRK